MQPTQVDAARLVQKHVAAVTLAILSGLTSMTAALHGGFKTRDLHTAERGRGMMGKVWRSCCAYSANIIIIIL